MLTAEIKQIINNARDILVGKVPDPKSQVDLITTAMIYKFMDDMDIAGQRRVFFVGDMEKYAFSKIMDVKQGAQQRLNLYAEALENLPFAASIPELFRKIFKDAFLPFRDPNTLTLFLREIAKFNYDNSENLGNAFEYLLSVMGSQGDAGQFRTPRHIIDFMVNVVQPTKDDTILDPACGTAGFLISAYLYVLKHNPELQAKDIRKLTENIIGYDISPDMVKLATVNMYLHRFNQPKIYEYDSLSDDSKWGDSFDCILANPPFMTPKGGIIPHNKFQVKANKAEVLFVDYIAEHLNMNGRAGIVVPEGIMFQTANAYKQLRKMLVDDNYLYAVVSLPNGVFNPYAGVKTSILFFDRKLAKEKKDILFVRINNDGFDLGAQRTPIKQNDLPVALEIIKKWKNGENVCGYDFAYIVSKEDIRATDDYNLSVSRYMHNQCVIESDYNMVKVGEVATFVRGLTFTKKDQLAEYVPGQCLKVVTTKAAQEDCVHHDKLYNIPKELLKNTNQLLKSGDILISIANSLSLVGRTTFCTAQDEGLAFGAFMGVVRANKELVVPEFLFALLNTKEAKGYFLATAKTTTNISNLNSKDILNYKIPLPPLDVQKRIVAEIENKQQAIDNAREIIRNLERERSYFASLLEGLDYKTVNLGDESYFTIESGGTPSTKNPEFWDGDIPWITLADIPSDDLITFIRSTNRSITKEGLKKSSAKLLPVNTVVVSTRATLGRVGIAQTPIATNQGFKNIIIKNEQVVNPVYLAWAMTQLQPELEANASGGTFKEISKTNFSKLCIPLPSLADQQKIADVFNKERQAIDSAKALIEHLESRITDVINRVFISATKDS